MILVKNYLTDSTLISKTISSQSGPGSNRNKEEIPHFPELQTF